MGGLAKPFQTLAHLMLAAAPAGGGYYSPFHVVQLWPRMGKRRPKGCTAGHSTPALSVPCPHLEESRPLPKQPPRSSTSMIRILLNAAFL